jgi:hypothetical protein
MTVIVYPIGKKFLLAAEYPIPSVTVPNAERLIEPSFTFKNADKVLQYILRLIFCMISKWLISGYHVPYPVLQSFTSAKRSK